MFFLLSKLLSFLLSPLTWIIVLTICSFLVRHVMVRRRLRLCALIIMLFFSNTFIFDRFISAWEVDAIPDAGGPYTAIVLTGDMSYDRENDRLEFNYNNDRLQQALRLYHEGNVRSLIVVSGSGSLQSDDPRTFDAFRKYLLSMGVKSEHLFLESTSRNTQENAVDVKQIITTKNLSQPFLLITSGYHMRRALACFDKQGLKCIPYSTDRYGGPFKWQFDYLLLPSAETLFLWEKLLHEWMGCVMYKLMGYI